MKKEFIKYSLLVLVCFSMMAHQVRTDNIIIHPIRVIFIC